jgi:hypothetical protein
MFPLAMAEAGLAAPGPMRIVAGDDGQVNAGLAPPVIFGRRFWNMLSVGARLTPAPAGEEPMVREAAICYHVPDLRTPKGDPLAVSVDCLEKLKPAPDPRVPFVVYTSAGRPPFRCLDAFQADRQGYEKWKAAHPNFLGFWTGVEWDNEYLTALNSPQRAAQEWRKKGYSETALEKMQSVVARAGVDRRGAVEGLHACYDGLRRYFFDDPEHMTFLRGGWCFDHYPLEWGAGLVISETTNTGNYRHQVSLFNVRGAARQYGKPWEWYIATYYNGHDAQGKLSVNNEPNYVSTTRSAAPGSQENSGPGFGMSVSLNRRDMYLAYLSGASFVDHEDWGRAYCLRKEGDSKRRELSPHGEAMREWYAFTQRHADRGVSYAPVALLMPFDQGYPQWGGHPWSHFPVERGDAMIDAFLYTVVPHTQDTRRGLEGCLSNSPLGDIYDVLLPNPPSGPIPLDRLRNYRVAILLGAFDLDAPLAARLADYVRQGGTLVVNVRQVNGRLPPELLGAKPAASSRAIQGPVAAASGGVTLDEPYDFQPLELHGAEPLWTDTQGGVVASVNRYGRGRVVLTAVDYMLPRTPAAKGAGQKIWTALLKGKRMPLVEDLMRRIVDEVLPIAVHGDIEYGLSKVADGWWVYLINNRGVTKFTQTPETFDAGATARVTVDMRRLAVAGLRELRAEQPITPEQGKNAFTIDVGPGDIRVVKIVTAGTRPAQ